ncbi:rubrerythrin [Carboxydocella sp. JDF658]|nr:rubrerythrin [Carboxydocella sp. JDF658]
MMSTTDNLKAAFAGESQANRKYLAFAKQAEKEGYPGVAKLFRAAAEAETIHAHAHLRVLGEIKSTAENLQAAIQGETYEFEKMYPGFIATAQQEGNKQAERSFHMANEAEKVHEQLFSKALANLESKFDAEYFVCEVCGHIAEGNAPDKCPICGVPGSKYFQVK